MGEKKFDHYYRDLLYMKLLLWFGIPDRNFNKKMDRQYGTTRNFDSAIFRLLSQGTGMSIFHHNKAAVPKLKTDMLVEFGSSHHTYHVDANWLNQFFMLYDLRSSGSSSFSLEIDQIFRFLKLYKMPDEDVTDCFSEQEIRYIKQFLLFMKYQSKEISDSLDGKVLVEVFWEFYRYYEKYFDVFVDQTEKNLMKAELKRKMKSPSCEALLNDLLEQREDIISTFIEHKIVNENDVPEENNSKDLSDFIGLSRWMVPLCIHKGLFLDSFREKQEAIYALKQKEGFYEFLDFFSQTAPIQVLGHFLKTNMYDQERHEKEAHILVRPLPSKIIFAQEFMYACWYAIKEKKGIRYINPDSSTEVILEGKYCSVLVKDKEFPNLVYENKKKEKIELPLYGNIKIEVLDAWEEEDMIHLKPSMEKEKLEYLVRFLEKDGESYIREKIEKGERKGYKRKIRSEEEKSAVISREKMMEMDHIYYGPSQYKCYDVCFEIEQDQKEEFERWLDSFGDFAYVLDESVTFLSELSFGLAPSEEKEKERSAGKLPVNARVYSLYTPVNSYGMLEQIKNETEKKRSVSQEEKHFLNSQLITIQEIKWLKMIFYCFPNLSQIFFSAEDYEEIRKSLGLLSRSEPGDLEPIKEWIKTNWPVQDIQADFAVGNEGKNYRNLLNCIRKKYVIKSKENGREHDQIVPVFLEYNAKEMTGQFQIMAYNRKEFRTILIKNLNSLGKSDTGKRGKDVSLSDLQKIYFCAVEEILNQNGQSRKIPQNIKSSYIQMYEKMEKKNSAFFREENSFTYIYRYVKEEDEAENWTRDEKRNGITRITPSELYYRTAVLKQIAKTSEGTKKLLSVPDPEEMVMKEVRYLNENIKREKVIVRYRKELDENKNLEIINDLEMIRDYFSEFDLEIYREKNQLMMVIYFETFYYRKIHSILLALQNLIEIEGPENLKNVVNQRIENKKKMEGLVAQRKLYFAFRYKKEENSENIMDKVIKRVGIKSGNTNGVDMDFIWLTPLGEEQMFDMDYLENTTKEKISCFLKGWEPEEVKILLYITGGTLQMTAAAVKVLAEMEHLEFDVVHADASNHYSWTIVQKNVCNSIHQKEREQSQQDSPDAVFQLCEGRHDILKNLPCIFGSDVDPKDVDKMEEEADSVLKDYRNRKIRVFTSGLKSLIVAVIHAGWKYQVNLELMFRDGSVLLPEDNNLEKACETGAYKKLEI